MEFSKKHHQQAIAILEKYKRHLLKEQQNMLAIDVHPIIVAAISVNTALEQGDQQRAIQSADQVVETTISLSQKIRARLKVKGPIASDLE